jgi:hypothetical protein
VKHPETRHPEFVSGSIEAAISGGKTALMEIAWCSIAAPDGAWMDAETRSA